MSRQKCSSRRDVRCLHRRRITKRESQSEDPKNYIGGKGIAGRRFLWFYFSFAPFFFAVFLRVMSAGEFALHYKY